MAALLTIFFGGLLFFYAAVLLALMWGFSRLSRDIDKRSVPSLSAALPSVAVVVAARNEARNLPRLLSCLMQQEYPADRLQVIIVDDRSEDETWEILERAERDHSSLTALRITDLLPDFAPKKRALDLAIRSSESEIILLTDADCTPPPTWVRATVSYYRDGVNAVLGFSPYRFDARLPQLAEDMLSLDYFSLGAIAAASVGLGRPLTATGTNLSYRRSTFLQAQGFENIKRWVSGDDDLFIQRAVHEKLGGFSYALSPDAFVPAAAPSTWRQFWNQRIRYASKARQYDVEMIVGLVAVYLLNAFIVAGIVSVFMGQWSFFGLALAAWIIKAALEYVFLLQASRGFGQRQLLKYFLPTEIFHPLYVAVFGFLGLFARYRWKGAMFSKRVPIPPLTL
ncbi:MAG: glycosyltransferase [Ignavibacteriales bacterium]|nr:glycosyltransferase [Ignavibacteriales bacterium]